jgi:hypothetical protein
MTGHSPEHQHRKFFIGSRDLYTFDYREYGVQGVGKNHLPMVNMDKYVGHDQDQELHIECCKGLAMCDTYKMGMTYGAIPPEERARFAGRDCWSEMLAQLSDVDPQGVHRAAILEILDTVAPNDQQYAVYKYAYFALGAPIPWYFALYLKKGDFFKKGTDENSHWTPQAAHFPKLVKYLDTLPFKSIGRVLFFTTYPNAGVMTHRDSVVTPHKDHNINLFFNAGRPSFVWDEIKKEKTYLDPSARSYFFNNRDYHGVDPEPVFRYTLRVDGTFTDELCNDLGLEEGYTWKTEY